MEEEGEGSGKTRRFDTILRLSIKKKKKTSVVLVESWTPKILTTSEDQPRDKTVWHS